MLEIVVIIIKSGSVLKQDKSPLSSDGDPSRQSHSTNLRKSSLSTHLILLLFKDMTFEDNLECIVIRYTRSVIHKSG